VIKSELLELLFLVIQQNLEIPKIVDISFC